MGDGPISIGSRRAGIDDRGLCHADPAAVTAPLFDGGHPFFLSVDKVQVKYEMLRARAVDGLTVVAAASGHGYSRASFYVVQTAFTRDGMSALFDEKTGRRGPTKLTDEIVTYLRDASASASGALLAVEVNNRFGVSLHRRTVERARRR